MKGYILLVQQHTWMVRTAEIAALTGVAWILRHVIITRLRRFARHTSGTLDYALIEVADRAIRPLLVVAVALISLNFFELPTRFLRAANRGLSLTLLLVVLFYGSRATRLVLDAWLARKPGRESFRDPVRFVSQLLFAAFGLLIVLNNLGISLTAVWTTLGVGSVAVALALQDTLSNFFAGVYLRLDNPIRIEDYIKLESGEEGFVVQQGWRSTRIRTLPNNIVIVPNAKLASAIVTNYSLPEPQMSLLISVSVSYDASPERVERILIEEATRAAPEIEGLLAQPRPFVRFIPGFGASSLDFTLICRVNTFVDQYLVQHELRKRIFARFRRERITIPFPQRDVHLYSHDEHGDFTPQGGDKRHWPEPDRLYSQGESV